MFLSYDEKFHKHCESNSNITDQCKLHNTLRMSREGQGNLCVRNRNIIGEFLLTAGQEAFLKYI